MSRPRQHQTEHQINVRAPAGSIYGLIADISNWPRMFSPTVHIEQIESGRNHERIQLWATANEEVKTWTSRRTFDQDSRRVDFKQEVSQAPVDSMGGTWIVEPLSENESLVRLLHDYRAVDDSQENIDWISRAVDTNSESELKELKTEAELQGLGNTLLTFEDTVRIAARKTKIYQFLYEAQLWQERLHHVERVSMREDDPNIQLLEMDTRAKNGSLHTTKSVRVCFPEERIVYKQLRVPALSKVHNGQWTLVGDDGDVSVTSQHTVVIREEAIPTVLGQDRHIEDARSFIHSALSTNSVLTLNSAKQFSETRLT